MSATEITRRILSRLPELYTREEPTTTEEYNAPNGSFEVAGPPDDSHAAGWVRSSDSVNDVFETFPITRGRVAITLADPPSSDPLYPVLVGAYAYVLGDSSATKDSRTLFTGEFVRVDSTYRFEVGGTADLTHLAFRYAYLSEPNWTQAGQWVGELLFDEAVAWSVDLFSGADRYSSYQEVAIPPTLARGYHTFSFRLRYLGAGYTGPLPTFLVDDVRMLRRTSQLATILWVVLSSIAAAQQRAHDARHAVRDLLSLGRSAGVDLENRGGEYGVGLPVTLGLSDAQYRDLIRLLTVEPRTTLKALRDVVKVLTGVTPTFVQTGPVGNVPPKVEIILGSSALTPAQGSVVQNWFYG